MKYLKHFETKAQYESFKGSSDFVLPNVSYLVENNNVVFHSTIKEKPIVLKAKYNAVDDGNHGMVCYYYNDGNIKSIKIDGNTVQFDPEINHSNNFEINTANTVIDWDEWTATCPDEYLINGKIKSWTIKPKDSSIVLTQEDFDNEDIVLGYVYKEDYDDTKYIDYTSIYTDEEWDFDVASNSLSLYETVINYNRWSYYNCNFVLLKYNYDTEQHEMIDTVNEVEYITGGIPMYDYTFETEGYHEAEFTLKENYIGEEIFWLCPLTNVTIPDSVTSIGENAFRSCPLTNVTIPDSVTSIGENAFYDCFSLTDAVIGNSVTSIGDDTFRECISLANVTIPESVTSIGVRAFNSCKGLTSINMPDSIISIGKEAFNGCKGLTSINIPDSVTSIGDNAFGGCNSLTDAVIGNSVTSIGAYAFRLCHVLTSVYCESTTPPYLGNEVFNGVASNCIIYVPMGSVEAYKSSWSEYSSKIQGYNFN